MFDYQRQVTAADTRGPVDETPPEEELADDFGELEVAEYIVFLLALDTYLGYLEKNSGAGAVDALGQRGVSLLRLADSLHISTIGSFLEQNLKTNAQKTMLVRALKLHPSAENAGRRALMVRTVLERGGTTTMRAVFKTNRALQDIKRAIAASTLEDADAALDLFAAIPMKNIQIRRWIDTAAKLAGAGLPPGIVSSAGDGTADDVQEILKERATQQGAPAASEQAGKASQRHEGLIAKVQNEAESSARRAMDIAGQEDKPPTRSEVVGIATAAAVMAVSDPAIPRNRPRAFQGPPPADDEQLIAGLSDGKVLVAAGAGAGKSKTLVSRIQYLIEDKKVSPSRIMTVTFNTGAADELKHRVDEAMGPGFHRNLSIGTMHSVFRRFIRGGGGVRGFGTAQEAQVVSDENLIQRDGKKKGGEEKKEEFEVEGKTVEAGPRKQKQAPPKGVHLTNAIRGMWKDCGPEGIASMTGFPVELFKDAPAVSAKACRQFMENWRGNDIDFKTARLGANTIEELYGSIWYEMYHGLKGDLGMNWAPCGGMGSGAYAKFVARFREPEREGGPPTKRLGDADDMIRIFRDILRRNPEARKVAQGMFDHICVDEAQDLNEVQIEVFDMMTEHITEGSGKSFWMVGDDKQCVLDETPVSTPTGTVKARDLAVGDHVLAFRNGKVMSQVVRHVAASSWTEGIKITTESGKTLTMSPNHKIWASSPELEDGEKIVYLMYRSDLGFRVGVTNVCEDGYNPFGRRTLTEKAERLWIIARANDNESALLAETTFSLKYGVPTAVFNGESRGINQARLNELFQRFGKNGGKLLEDLHLSFDLPNWLSTSYSKGTIRRTIQMVSHAAAGTQVWLEWTGNDLDEVLQGISYTKLEGGRNRLRKWFTNYRQALTFAESLQSKTKANLRRRISTDTEPFPLITAGGLLPGMSVLVQEGETVAAEKIVGIESVKGTFIDLDVDDASNFFGDGILSHNSIYQFRGARPSRFSARKDEEDFKTCLIQTNYRCEPEIVDAANNVTANNRDQIPMQCRAAPTKKRGTGSIEVLAPGDYVDGAFSVFESFESTMSLTGDKPSKFAVLSRNNSELNAFEDQCIIREVPYTRVNSKGFLESPETRVVLGYMDLAMSSDSQELQKSFTAAITKPDRGIFLGAEDIERIVQDTIKQVAHEAGVDSRSFNPLDFLTRPQMARKIADNLKRPYIETFRKRARAMENKFRGQGWLQTKMRQDGYDWTYYEAVDQLADQLMIMGKQITAIRTAVLSGAATENVLNTLLDDVKVESGYLNRKSGQDTRKVTSLRQQLREDIAFIRDPEEDGGDDAPVKVVIDENGMRKEVVDEKAPVEEDPLKGLGAVRYLFQLAAPNAKDRALGVDPSKGPDFYRKIDRYKQLSAELQDPEKYPDRIALSTVHSVKGKQWEHVALCMSYGFFPGSHKDEKNLLGDLLQKVNKTDPRPAEQHDGAKGRIDSIKEDPMTAERNLAYVGITRAQKDLIVVCSQERVPPKHKQDGPLLGQFAREAKLTIGENVEVPLAPAAPEDTPDAAEVVKVAGWIAVEDFDQHLPPEAFNDVVSYDRRPS